MGDDDRRRDRDGPGGERRGAAGRLALRRLPRALLVVLVAVGVAVAGAMPIGIVLAAAGVDVGASGQGSAATPVPPAAALFVGLYVLVLAGVALWVGARLFLLNAVVTNEAAGSARSAGRGG